MSERVCGKEMALVKITLSETGIDGNDVEECFVPDPNQSRSEFAFLAARIGIRKYVLKPSGATCQHPGLVRVLVTPNSDQRTIEDQVLFHIKRIQRRNAG